MSATPEAPGAAFDGVAERYDADFSERPLARALRERVRGRLAGLLPPGSRVLELGCGTGVDAVWLAERGVEVVATDASEGMLGRARARVEEAGAGRLVELSVLDLDDDAGAWDRWSGRPFDGALSLFGPLNCVSDRPGLARRLSAVLKVDAPLVLSVMGPVCLTETAGYLVRGRLTEAFRRWRREPRARVGEHRIAVDYPSPRTLRRELSPWFRRDGSAGLGLLLPPTDFQGFLDRHPRLTGVLLAADRALESCPGAAWLSDHHLTVYRRRRDLGGGERES